MIVAVVTLASAVFAQNADTRDLDTYLRAITQPAGSRRAAALEEFASSSSTSSLKLDALEWIVWEERQAHNDAAALTWAQRLLALDPDNALGLGMTAEAARQARQSSATYGELAQRGLNGLAALRRPEGMSHPEFMQLQQQAKSMLWSAAGYAQLEHKDYAAARAALAEAVVAAPADAHLVYALALADLSGDKPNRTQGYWLLARAVNLFGGAPKAREIEEFGRKRYKQDGGTDREWDQFLATTAAPGASAAQLISAAPAEQRSSKKKSASAKPAKNRAEPKVGGINSAATQEARNGGMNSAATRPPAWRGEREPPPESTEAANSLPPISDEAARAPRAGPPVSLGILIETSLARKRTRQAIVFSLSDLVRHLGLNDEAFILSFSHDLVFEEDLTGNSQRLEHALDQIKPHPGTALMDAVGFAAGHLQRISKNDNRVLLVISDGRNGSSRIPSTAASSEIRASGVKIYCIGVDVGGSDSRYRLQALANGTGGMASFITAPDQFRAAAQQVAGRIGIPFEF